MPRDALGRLHRARALYRNVSKRRIAWLLLKDTVNSCIEYRILGLAAEAAFFTLLSLPPLLLAWSGCSATSTPGPAPTRSQHRDNILEAARTVLSDKGVNEIAEPILDDVMKGGRPGHHLHRLPVRPVVGLARGERLHRHHHRDVRARRRPRHRQDPAARLPAVHRRAADRRGRAAADGGGARTRWCSWCRGATTVVQVLYWPVGDPPVGRLPDDALPRVRAGALAVDRGRAGRAGRPRHVGARQLPAADLPDQHGGGAHDLRLARGAGGGAAVDRGLRVRGAGRAPRSTRPSTGSGRPSPRPRPARRTSGCGRRRPRRSWPAPRPRRAADRTGRPGHAVRVPRALVEVPAAGGRVVPPAHAREEHRRQEHAT